MPEEYATKSDLQNLKERVVLMEKKASKHETVIQEITVSSLKEYNSLEKMITVAVENGNKELKEDITAYTKASEDRMCEFEARLYALEDEKKLLALKQIEQQKEDRKIAIKTLIKTVLACAITSIVSFYMAIYLNQKDLATERKEEIWKEQQVEKIESTTFQLQTMWEIPPTQN